MKKIITIILFSIFLFQSAYAATVYLDASASGCTGSGSSDADYDPATRSCGSGSDTVFAGNFPYEATTSLSNGDTLAIQPGTYYEDVSGEVGYTYAWGAFHVLADNITITNYNDGEVHIQGGSSGSSVVAHTNNVADLSGDGITLIGTGHKLFVYGCLIVSGTGNTVNGVDIAGGWDHQSSIGGDAWYDVFRFLNSTDATVLNSWIHDNYDHGTVTNAANMSFMMHDGDNNTIVHNNHFYNAVGSHHAVYGKYQSATGTVHFTYYKNWFQDCGLIQGPNEDHGKYDIVYQNVATGSVALIGLSEGISINSGFRIYNNTVWGSGAKLISSYTGNIPAFDVSNNIVVNTGSSVDVIAMDNATVPGTGWYFDYNDYYGTLTFRWTDSSHTFAQWQSFLSGEANSIETDPVFSADDSTVDGSDPSDFKRSSYTANGRGGSYPSVMGAYITGSEIIGVPATATTYNLSKGISGWLIR